LEKHAAIVNQDRFTAIKADYQANGPGRSNSRAGSADAASAQTMPNFTRARLSIRIPRAAG
jgi:hypothetical protein